MKKIICSLVLIVIISGCAAVGVPLTFNPNNKLDYAIDLLELDRPLPAEPLIREAIDIYKKRGDDLGLANAYRTYALFLQSEAVENWGKGYRSQGFMDKTVTFDNRYEKANEYFEMAKDIYERHSNYDGLTNIYLSIGKLYYFKFNDKETACDNFAKSLEYYLKFKRENPDTKVILPQGFHSFEEYIEAVKKEAACGR